LRVLGVDLGSVRIGIALSDAGGLLASPHAVIASEGKRRDVERIGELVASTGAELVVVGMPTTLRGEQGIAAQEVEGVVRALSEHLDVPVTTWDERMTTAAAERALLEAGKRREARREVRDKIAAALMLQSYLDAERSSRA
jgi:putative Holliday junction resolvase